MYHNYIFDLYGTLVNIHTEEDCGELWRRFALALSLQGAAYAPEELRKRYRELEARVQQECWKENRQTLVPAAEERDGWDLTLEETEVSLWEVYRRLYLEKGIEANDRRILDLGSWFRTLSLERLALYEGAKELLARLRRAGKGVYLLSNAQRMFTEPEMRVLDIYDKFDGILYSSDAGVKKPSPYFFQALFDRYGLKPEESVMVGNDRFSDVEGARRFGVDCIYVHTEESTPFTGSLPEDCKQVRRIGDVDGVKRICKRAKARR